MSAKLALKSILKPQPERPQPRVTEEERAKAEKDRRNLNIALQHAHLIQHQKDVQARILTSIENLIDIPSGPVFTAQEAVTFIELVQHFQPSDLDALAEERRIDGRCGYALCGGQPRSITRGASAVWKLPNGGADYCSAACVRKSLHVRTQLSGVPAWERYPTRHVLVKLYSESSPSVVQAPQLTGLSDVPPTPTTSNAAAEASKELALERGERPTSLRPKQVISDRIVEKRTVAHKPLSSVSRAELSSTAIEGYEPRCLASSRREDSDDDDDEDDGVEGGDDIGTETGDGDFARVAGGW